MTDIAGKVAVVTGGGSGIGRGLAIALAAEGAAVVVADIIKENADAVANEIQNSGGRAAAIVCDVSERAPVRKMKAEANQLFGPVSLLFANAGATAFEALTDMSDEDVDWILHVNLFGVMNCLQIFLPDMIAAKGGHVMATSSTAAVLPAYMDRHAPYVAAKSAILGMMLSMRTELTQYGIGATVLCPGAVTTRITDSPKYRPARFGGPFDGLVTLPTGAHAKGGPKFRPPEEIARMVLLAVRKNRPVVVTDASFRDLFQKSYTDVMLSAFDDVAEFDRANA